MRLKSAIISILMIITIAMGYILNVLLKLYRVSIVIDADSTPSEIKRFSNIIKYQNITWVLIAAMILGLIALLCIENKNKITAFIKNF